MLDLTTGMTLEAWVYPTAAGGGSWRNVLIKERAGGEVYNLYCERRHERAGGVCGARRADRARRSTRAGRAAVPLNTWTHWRRRYDGATLRLYVNGDAGGNASGDGRRC